MAKKYWWEEDEEQTTTNSQSGTQNQPKQNSQTEKKYWWEEDAQQSSGNSFWWDTDGSTITAIGNDVTTKVNNWLNSYNTYISDYQKRYSGRKGNLEDAYVSDSSDWLNTVTQRKRDLNTEADAIMSYLDQYKDYLDADWVSKVKYSLTTAKIEGDRVIKGARQDNKYWNSFGSDAELLEKYGSAQGVYEYYQRGEGYRKKYEGLSAEDLKWATNFLEDGEEKEWLTSYAASADYNEKSNYDVEAGEAEIAALEQEILDLDDYLSDSHEILHNYFGAEYDKKASELFADYGGTGSGVIDAMEKKQKEIEEKKKYIADAKSVQENNKEAEKWNSYTKAPDFEYYAQQGAAIENPTYGEAQGSFEIFGWNPTAKEIKNKATFARDNALLLGGAMANNSNPLVNYSYTHMTDDEVALYSYLLAKEGEDTANAYLSWLEPRLNDTEARRVANLITGIDIPVIEDLAIMGYGFGAGVDQWASGVKQFFSEDAIDPSMTQQTNAYISNSLDGIGYYAHQAATTVGNMAPSILASKFLGFAGASASLAQGTGTAFMGVSAAGNAYSDALQKGYDKGQARVYSTLVGASEALLERAIGGISSLGGISAKTAGKIASIDKGLLRAAARLGVSLSGEILEEELQNYLEPLFRTIIFGEEYDAPTIEELVETAIVTALSTGMLEGGDVIRDGMADKQASNDYAGSEKELIEQGLESGKFSESYQLAMKFKGKIDAGETLNGAEIRQLVEANDAAIAKENKEAKASTELIARNKLNKLGETENVNKIAKLVAKNVSGQELTASEKSTLVRSKYGAQVAKELRGESQAESGKKQFDISYKNAATYKPLEERVNSIYTTSESGEAVVHDTNEAISLDKAEVVKIGKDGMTLRVDGKEVSTVDIDFADDSQSYLYSAVSKIENITPGAATAIIRGYDSSSGQTVGEYLNGIDEAYTYGYHGYSEADLKAGNFAPKLTDKQSMSAYRLGQSARKISDQGKETARKKMRTAAQAEAEKSSATVSKKEKVAKQKARFESEAEVYFMDGQTMTKFDESGKYDDKRMAGVNYAKFLSKLGIGSKYYFFKSYENAEGVRVYKNAEGKEVVAPNGMYKANDGSIYIDLNAGDYGQGTTLFTLGHELTHFIKQWSEAKFKVLSDFLIEEYGKTDMSMHERVLEKQKQLSDSRGKNVSYNEAFEEVVADAMSTMLADGNLHEKLIKLKAKDKGLVAKIKEFFDKLIAKFNSAYAELTPEQRDARDVREMKDAFDRIQQVFAEALVEASENFQTAQNTAEGLENSEDIAYSKRGYQKVFFKENVFPPFNESHSEAHELAERWAKSEKTETGERKLISYHNQWYLIESFDGLKYGYQIMKKLTKQQYIKEASHYGTVTGYQSLQSSLSEDAAQHYRRSSDGDAGHRIGNDASEHRGKNRTVHELGENEVRRKTSERNGTRNLSSSGLDSQGENGSAVRNSDRDSHGNKLSKEQQVFFKDSKAVDKDGNLMVVYHGTRKADFTVFNRNVNYFTDSKEMADSYSPNGDMYEGYVNITKPYEIDAKGEKWSKIPIDDATKNFLQKYGASVFKEGGKWRTSPADIASAIEEAVDNGDMDYDGIIIRNIDDTGNYYKDKDSHLATDYLVFNSNQFKKMDNTNPTTDPDIRYSKRNTETDQADIHSRIFDLQSEEGQLNRSIKEIESSDDFKAVQEKMYNADSVEDGVNQYLKWKEESGYGSLLAKRDSVREELKKLREERDNTYADESAEKERQAIAKSGLSEAEYFRKQAVNEFGYTPYFYDAGYLTPNGKLLNFSGEKGKHFGSRGEDHRAIGIIYENTQGSDAMVRFMNDGNIRIMAETPGLDISSAVEPTSEQYATIRKFARESVTKGYFAVDISDENGRVIGNYEYDGYVNADRVVNDIKYFFENGKVREQSSVARFLNSERTNAPTFYSQMAKVVDGVKQEKLGASSVVNMLRGKGVKAEEIKWSGIEEWLNGKKSVTKAELQEFIAGSQLQIEEAVLDGSLPDNVELKNVSLGKIGLVIDGKVVETYKRDKHGYWIPASEPDAYGYSDKKTLLQYELPDYGISYSTKWSAYTLDGGKNYREIVFKMPNSTYSNSAMKTHWGVSAQGVLAHARIQDFKVNGKKMLFIEEIQSDWHNEGHKQGYVQEGQKFDSDIRNESADAYHDFQASDVMQSVANRIGRSDFDGNVTQLVSDLFDGNKSAYSDVVYYGNLTAKEKAFIDKAIAEESQRQQELAKAPNASKKDRYVPDAPFKDNYHEFVLKRLLREAAEKGYDSIGWTTADIQSKRWSDEFAEGYRIEYDQDIPKFMKKYGKQWDTTVGKTVLDNGTEVWSMAITDSMKQSVLEEGQTLYQERNLGDTSNRSLLANAFEGITQNSNEYKLIQEYKGRIKILNEYEAKLDKLNAEIREIRFGTTGPRDMARLQQLETDAKNVAKDINRQDKKLLSLEASEPLRKVIERERKKEAKKTVEHIKEIQQNKKDRAEQAEYRYKIRNFKKKLEGKLLRPTDRQYVPVDLIKAMVEVCEIIDTDTDLYKADGSINKAQVKRDETKEKLSNLKDAYENLQNHSDPIYAGEFDDVVYDYLKELRVKFSDKSLKEMSLDELAEMYEILVAIDETLADARKLIGWGDAESVYEAGDAIVEEQLDIMHKRKHGKRNAAQKGLDKIDNLGLSPVRNVERMAGYNQDSSLLKLFKKFEYGVRKKNKFKMDAYKSFEGLTAGKEYDDAVYKEVEGKKYTDVKGREFGVSKMQMMQAILSLEREKANKNLHHIENGGFTFADLKMLRKGKLKEAVSAENSHRVAAATGMVLEFQEALKDDKWCQDYMTAARNFFNGMAKDAINETSIALKHRIIAKDKNYIPFEVDTNFVNTEITDMDAVQKTINAYGMLKETVDNAPQSIYITGLNNILDRHIEQVSTIHGLAIEVRNFNKVWNVRYKDVSNNSPTVKESIDTNWGKDGVKNIEQAVKDIQGPRVRERNALYDKVKSGYIGSTFLLNLSVVTKQIGSLFSATSMLKWRDPARMIGNLLYTMANHKKISAEVDKYTATAWMRRQGMSDAELYTLMTQAKKPGFFHKLDKAPAIINPTKWITAMDHAVALSLWRYAKQDTAKMTGLKGEELLKATAEFYDELVENTQSMTDVLHRPEIQKRGDIISESFAMFKTDLYQMAGQLQATTGRYMANKSKENGTALGRTVYSIAMSAIWGQLMTTVFALLRYKVNPYRDDEDDELTVESWLKRQGFGLVGDLMGYILPIFGSEVVGVFENIMYGESDDAVDSIVLTAINDLYNAMITVGASIKDGEMPDEATMKKLTAKALQLFGIPANNILRTWEAIQLHAEDIANGEFFSFNAGVDSKTDDLYDAIVNGNKAVHAKLKAAYVDKEGNFDKDKYENAVVKALRENDPRIKEAAQAGIDGNSVERNRIFKEIKAELGAEYANLIIDAINAETTAIRNKDKPDKVQGQYSAYDFVEAVSSSDAGTAKAVREDIISTYKANGKTQAEAEKAFQSDVKSGVQEAYSYGTITKTTAEKMLVDYAGIDEEDAADKITYWEFQNANPDCDLNESRVLKYLEFAEPAHISLEVYEQFVEETSGLGDIKDKWGDVEVTKREQVLEVIDSLPLTWQQKDALYLAYGYKESTIWDVPW